MIALIDANNFFVSCERLFNPRLEGRPVVVLSNNDGCVIARSPEAKTVGVPMGEPWFNLAPRARALNLVARSSNYELYGDLSQRLMTVLAELTVALEPYSIDEAFGRVPEADRADAAGWAGRVRAEVARRVGLPVSVGLAPTKTLAKLANHGAKRSPGLNGVCHWMSYSPRQTAVILAGLPVTEVWGVAHRTAVKLAEVGVTTVAELRACDAVRVRSRWGIRLARTVLELQGVACSEDESPPTQHSVMTSRMFGQPTDDPAQVLAAVVSFTQQAANRLRRRGQVAAGAQAWASSGRLGQHSWVQVSAVFSEPTADPVRLCRAVRQALAPRLQAGGRYNRAGVVLSGLSADDQPSLLAPPDLGLGPVLDRCHRRFGDNAVGLGAAGLRHPAFAMRQELLSGRYTTCWNELMKVRAG
ncbi:MAG: Y-family DNA polymerase [Propionibacteriaceae bacterium]|nr:Y-family DNA polymerase [Propionibacteriaceae bacterium]